MRRAILALCCMSPLLHADPVTLRMASAVPEGTAWARVGKAFARDVEELTHGEVRVKWYLGGIAGDEMQVLDRMRRDQLDGVGSGGVLCQRLAPTMRVTRLIGMVRTRAEAELVLTRLKPQLDEEFKKSGFVNLWEAGIGPSFIFSRAPVHDLTEMKKSRLWIWDLDDLFGNGLRSLGINVVPTSLESAAHAYDENKFDGMVVMPMAALAFQWSVQSRYLTPLTTGFLSGCFLMSNRAYDALPVESQKAIRDAAAKFQAHMEDVGREQDAQLVDGGLFKRQGLSFIPVTQAFKDAFYAAARAVRDQDTSVTPQLKAQVESWLKEYRSKDRTATP
jgi:TRAP-type C4-dicarboxylate transport system substrate-binding protein